MTKRAVLPWARVSSNDRDREDRNLLGQLDLCREYAQERGYENVEELAEACPATLRAPLQSLNHRPA
jgi:site-specific DNA recombinase